MEFNREYFLSLTLQNLEFISDLIGFDEEEFTNKALDCDISLESVHPKYRTKKLFRRLLNKKIVQNEVIASLPSNYKFGPELSNCMRFDNYVHLRPELKTKEVTMTAISVGSLKDIVYAIPDKLKEDPDILRFIKNEVLYRIRSGSYYRFDFIVPIVRNDPEIESAWINKYGSLEARDHSF